MCGRVSASKLCMDKLCCMHACMYVCIDGWIDGWMDVWMHIYIYIYIWCQMATDDAGTTISSNTNMSQCTQKCK